MSGPFSVSLSGSGHSLSLLLPVFRSSCCRYWSLSHQLLPRMSLLSFHPLHCRLCSAYIPHRGLLHPSPLPGRFRSAGHSGCSFHSDQTRYRLQSYCNYPGLSLWNGLLSSGLHSGLFRPFHLQMSFSAAGFQNLSAVC